ncbi:hypothetical protein JYU14_00595 [Simkania negevensis]|uniref:Uncharacterized protein n=1 Tax=Simkania negevensis TaxID=83561 RepID=A0ABS3AR59_9BACT|nr:hypothetical protein [Simkania negevensis]
MDITTRNDSSLSTRERAAHRLEQSANLLMTGGAKGLSLISGDYSGSSRESKIGHIAAGVFLLLLTLPFTLIGLGLSAIGKLLKPPTNPSREEPVTELLPENSSLSSTPEETVTPEKTPTTFQDNKNPEPTDDSTENDSERAEETSPSDDPLAPNDPKTEWLPLFGRTTEAEVKTTREVNALLDMFMLEGTEATNSA